MLLELRKHHKVGLSGWISAPFSPETQKQQPKSCSCFDVSSAFDGSSVELVELRDI
jgi:hypothetical protein